MAVKIEIFPLCQEHLTSHLWQRKAFQMDLFRINRYMVEETEYSQENETLKLARLQQQIKERVKTRQREKLKGRQTETILEDGE